MGPNLKLFEWHKVGLQIQGKWGDASHQRNSDRQSHKDLKPTGWYARQVIKQYEHYPDWLLLAEAMKFVMLSNYGPALVSNFKLKTGKKMTFKIKKWNGPGTSKVKLMDGIEKKVQGFHDRFHLPPFGNGLMVNIDDEIRKHLPSFAFAPLDPSEMIAIGGIQEVNIISENSLHSIGYDYWDRHGNIHNRPHRLSVKLKFLFRDWFGVDEGDFANLLKPTVWMDQPGLACFWILQHQRGYPPFITEWSYEETISIPLGNY